MTRYFGSSPKASCILSFWAIYRIAPWGTPLNGLNQQCMFHYLPPIKCPAPSSSLCPARSSFTTSKNIQIYFLPSHLTRLLTLASPCKPSCSFTLHTVTSFHRPELHHYYGFICHLTPHRIILSFPLISPIHKEEQCKASPVKANSL